MTHLCRVVREDDKLHQKINIFNPSISVTCGLPPLTPDEEDQVKLHGQVPCFYINIL